MNHRHLNNPGFSPEAIDDIISRGKWRDWEGLRHAVLSDPEVFDDMRRVADYRAKQEWSQQRYQFWANYAEAHARTS